MMAASPGPEVNLAVPADTIALGTPVLRTASMGILPVVTTDSVQAFVSRDGGATWTPAAVIARDAQNTGVSVSDGVAGSVDWVAVGSTLYISQDAGVTWQRRSANVPGIPFGFWSAKNGWALATQGTCANGKTGCKTVVVAYRTTDGGTSWQHAAVNG